MKSLFWHRRDLRIEDNTALFKALKETSNVIPLFIFDTIILDQLSENDQRVLFIHQEVSRLKEIYQSFGSDLIVKYGNPIELVPEIAQKYEAQVVYTNRDYEPYALQRDQTIYTTLSNLDIVFKEAKDHVIFEKEEILKPDQHPYTIFTPYMKRWKEKLSNFYLSSYPVEKYITNLWKTFDVADIVSLNEMGFSDEQIVAFPEPIFDEDLIRNYDQNRDLPSVLGTSRLSLHLRFGTISIRFLARKAMSLNEKFLNELIWRDFYQMIIYHFPYSIQNSFKKQYDRIQWVNNEEHFQLWCKGQTGYPIVDAGMRELNATGFMHNRVRMIVASFLTKHLLIDWRWGESYFAEKLLDFELASNVGGWQWAASSGCDTAPYFRVFNPTLQQEKFDKEYLYIKKWVPEFGTDKYVKPIIDHSFARDRVLRVYKAALH